MPELRQIAGPNWKPLRLALGVLRRSGRVYFDGRRWKLGKPGRGALCHVTEGEVLAILRQHGSMSQVDLAKALHRPWRLIWPALRDLTTRGQVRRDGRGPKSRYSIARAKGPDLRYWDPDGPDTWRSGLLGLEGVIERQPDGSWTATLTGLAGGRTVARNFASVVAGASWIQDTATEEDGGPDERHRPGPFNPSRGEQMAPRCAVDVDVEEPADLDP